MKILITGGCGFIGSYVAERFAKEGYSIYIIDNLSTGVKSAVKPNYKFYNLSVADKRCEELFRIHNFDIVVHLAANSDGSSSDAYSQSETNVLGLINMLNFSQKYGVKKFIFASSADVYGNKVDLPVAENAELTPVSTCGVNKAAGEYYCEKWRELYGLNTIILRLASVYGPSYAFNGKQGDIPTLIKKAIDQDEIVIYGDASQTKDYIHVQEVAYIIYQVAVKEIPEKILNVSTNTEVSLKELLGKVSVLEPINNIRYEQKRKTDIERMRLDNTLLSQKLNWQPKHSFDDGLRQTYEWYQKSYINPVSIKKDSAFRNGLDIIRPYLENIIIFILLWFLNFGNHVSFLDSRLGIDYNYVYIAVMGFLYGKKQSMIATVLSGALFTANFLARGGDWVALIYQSQYLFHLATYLCVGVVTGFAMDNKERIIKDITQEIESLKDRHAFLEKVHLEANQIKDDLYGQIVNTDDSIGKIYSIVHKLDTLESEKIYTAAADIVKNALKANFAALYTVNKSETYLRLKTKVGENPNCPNSLKIDDYPYIQTLMTEKRVFINKNMEENCPDMAAPILYQGRVFAVLQVHDLPFGSFSLFYENMFRIMAMLIDDALIKAYLYSEDTKDKKYLKNTNILIAEEFDKIYREISTRHDLFDQSSALLQINEKPDDYEKFYQTLSPLFRAEDYIGLNDDGYVRILLINIVEGTVEKVQERLKKVGFSAKVEG